MNRTEEQWTILQNELELLRDENQMLKRTIAELKAEADNNNQISLFRSSLQSGPIRKSNSREQTSPCKHCQHGVLPPSKSKEELVNQFQSWSETLRVNLFRKRKESEIRRAPSSSQNIESPAKQSEQGEKEEGFIDKICLFGPKEENAVTITEKKVNVPHQLYYPKKDPHFSLYESYGYSLYPDEVEVKVIREKNKGTEIDRMIFRKTLKATDCKLVIFQSKEQFNLPENKIRRSLNPFSTVFCVSIDFTDFLHSELPYQGKFDRMNSMTQDVANDFSLDLSPTSPQKVFNPNRIVKKDSSIYGATTIYKSNFSLSLMSYYPFLDFLCQFLIQLINQIKIGRIEQHAKNPQVEAQIDINYVVKRLQSSKPYLDSLISQKIDEATKLNFKLGQTILQLGLTNMKEELSRDWAYRMLRLLDKETAYQLFCLVLQQQSLCFVSQSSYVLTFMIYLFVGLLIHPFSYPHTIVSSVFEMDHLETPFIAVMGLNKSIKWIQANEEEFMEKIAGKILVILQEQEVKIKSRKKTKVPKSDRLKKIFSNFYKRVQKLEPSARRKQTILSRDITRAQNELTQFLMTQLQIFFNDELLRFLPNRQIISSMQKQLAHKNTNMASVSAKLIKKIEQFVGQSRKKIQRDPFIDMLIQRQIFSVYLTIYYDIT